MPWEVGDVNGFKKGLSVPQKRRWVKIANAILADCQKRGGKDCERVAIATASARVGKPAK